MHILNQINERYTTIHYLETVQELLDWDQQVMMPAAGASQRGDQMAVLARQIHQALTDPVLGDLLDQAGSRNDLDEEVHAGLRVLRRRRDRAVRVPIDLMTRHARLAAVAQGIWEKALAEKSFAVFRDVLAEVVAATRDIGMAINADAPYDALIEEYEPGMDSGTVAALFSHLDKELIDIIREHRETPRPSPCDFKSVSFPARVQRQIVKELLQEMGLDFDGLRLDVSTHPCTSGTGRDVRITTRYDRHNPVSGILSAVHEGGHALYEQGLPLDRLVTPGGGFCSFGIHESQSLFWENIIGRGRPFLDRLLSRLSEAFPGTLDGVDGERFFWTVNRVRPSAVRIEADELTYTLHIVIRFELERALISGDLSVEDLPDAWNRLYKDRLGIRPRNHAKGVLQDIHWAAGLFGYFPSYALGYIYAAQFYAALVQELPDVEEDISRGDFEAVTAWLKDRVHKPAGRRLPSELVQAVTHAPPSAEHLIGYWRRKYLADM